MFPVLLAEEDCSIKRGQPSITRDLPKSEVIPFSALLCFGWLKVHFAAFLGLVTSKKMVP